MNQTTESDVGASTLPTAVQNGNMPAPAERAHANLPASYQAAKQAIEKCERTDECRNWADKAAAMAAYARMRDDRDLHNYALRIQLRAERRWGELDRELFPDRHRENLQQHRNAVDRISAPGPRPAPSDGTSEYQRRVARQLAVVPASAFERQVESSPPPSKTQLAAQGKTTRTAPAAAARALAGYSKACESLAQFAQFCDRTEPTGLARALHPEDIETARQYVAIADRWLDQFVTNLPGGDAA